MRFRRRTPGVQPDDAPTPGSVRPGGRGAAGGPRERGSVDSITTWWVTGPCPSRTSTCPTRIDAAARRGPRPARRARPRAGARSSAGQLTVRRMQPFVARPRRARRRPRGRRSSATGTGAGTTPATTPSPTSRSRSRAIGARYGRCRSCSSGTRWADGPRCGRPGTRRVRGVVALAPWLPGHRTGRAARRSRPRGAARHPRPHHQPAGVGAVRRPGGAVRPARGVPAGAVERSRDAAARASPGTASPPRSSPPSSTTRRSPTRSRIARAARCIDRTPDGTASTGVIGQPLPIERIVAGHAAPARRRARRRARRLRARDHDHRSLREARAAPGAARARRRGRASSAWPRAPA